MAYVDDSFEQNQQNAQQNQGVAPTLSGSGSAGSTASSAAPSTGAGASAQAKQPTGFADLNNYLKINAPQQFGSQLAGKVGQDIQAGQDTLNNAETQFKQRADTGTVKDTDNLTGQVSTNPENIDATKFQSLLNASYNGPVSLQDATDLNNQVQGTAGSAIGKANASQTEGGRFALLGNYFNRPTYNQGEKSLDNLLVQNDPNSQQAFNQMRQNAQTLQQNVNQAGTDLGNYGANAAATTQATNQAARAALGVDAAGNPITGQGAIGNEVTSLTNQANTLQGLNTQQQQDIATALQTHNLNNLTPAEQQILGLQNFQGSIYNVDPNSFFQVNSNPVTAGEVATPADVARWNALQKLAGQDLTGTLDLSQAGTAPNAGTFNNAAFNNAITQAQDAYNTARNQNETSFLTNGYANPNGSSGNLVHDYAYEALNNFNAGLNPTIMAQVNAPRSASQQIDFLNTVLARIPSTPAPDAWKNNATAAIQQEIAAQQQQLSNLASQYGVNNTFAGGSPTTFASGAKFGGPR